MPSSPWRRTTDPEIIPNSPIATRSNAPIEPPPIHHTFGEIGLAGGRATTGNAGPTFTNGEYVPLLAPGAYLVGSGVGAVGAFGAYGDPPGA